MRWLVTEKLAKVKVDWVRVIAKSPAAPGSAGGLFSSTSKREWNPPADPALGDTVCRVATGATVFDCWLAFARIDRQASQYRGLLPFAQRRSSGGKSAGSRAGVAGFRSRPRRVPKVKLSFSGCSGIFARGSLEVDLVTACRAMDNILLGKKGPTFLVQNSGTSRLNSGELFLLTEHENPPHRR